MFNCSLISMHIYFSASIVHCIFFYVLLDISNSWLIWPTVTTFWFWLFFVKNELSDQENLFTCVEISISSFVFFSRLGLRTSFHWLVLLLFFFGGALPYLCRRTWLFFEEIASTNSNVRDRDRNNMRVVMFTRLLLENG